MPTLLAFVGPSGSGKTTLIEKLVPALRATGLTVGVIKNDAHGFQMDTEGKDSDRFFRAGADGVLIQSPSEVAYRRVHAAREEPAHLAERYFPDCDLVIVEGGRDSALPKIEVWRTAAHAARLDPCPAHLVACVADAPAAAEGVTDLPTFLWNDIDALRDFIRTRIAQGRTDG